MFTTASLLDCRLIYKAIACDTCRVVGLLMSARISLTDLFYISELFIWVFCGHSCTFTFSWSFPVFRALHPTKNFRINLI